MAPCGRMASRFPREFPVCKAARAASLHLSDATAYDEHYNPGPPGFCRLPVFCAGGAFTTLKINVRL